MPKGVYKRKPMSEKTKKKMSESRKGRVVSKETRKKISESNKGKQDVKGVNNPFYGRKHSSDNKNKISKALKGKYIGIKSSQWKGGVTPEIMKLRNSPEYKEWRDKVYKRDNYTCQTCGYDKGKILNAHHIMSFSKYPKYRFWEEFGQTLCKYCHTELHKELRKVKKVS